MNRNTNVKNRATAIEGWRVNAAAWGIIVLATAGTVVALTALKAYLWAHVAKWVMGW